MGELHYKPRNVATWGACVVSVPLLQTALLAWEYLLRLPLANWVAVVVLVLVGTASLAFLVTQFSSRAHQAVVGVAFVAWVASTYLAVSFYIGCRWAQACV